MIYCFDGFELDTDLFELRHEGRACPIEPQVFNVLRYLIEHADHVVSKDELFAELWPGRVVSESALTSRLKTARKLIGDTGRDQRLIRTVHGRGYRFVGEVSRQSTGSSGDGPAAGERAVRGSPAAEPRRRGAAPPSVAPPLAGRELELASLGDDMRAALDRRLRIDFIEGEAGIGKTTLIEAFINQVRGEGLARVAVGQCSELSATGDAYLPVLDALGLLCRGSDAATVIECLRVCAPTWLLQLPGLLSQQERTGLERQLIGVTQERMLREFAAAMGELGEHMPIVLVLEDLHWADPSTLSLLAWLGRRRESMPLFIVATHRPVHGSQANIPLAETVYGLRLRGLARTLSLGAFDAPAVTAYLERRFPGLGYPRRLVTSLLERTEGNPLFLVSVVDGWIERGMLKQSAEGWVVDADDDELFRHVPQNLKLLIEEQLGRLDPAQRRLLEAASVAGTRFSAALVETLLGEDCERCESELARLADTTVFIARDGEARWPHGSVASQFRFEHVLYRETLYGGLTARARARMHAAAGHRLERALGGSAAERAVELAVHFTAGGDDDKAVDYRMQAANQAFARGGYREAISHLEQGLAVLREHAELDRHGQRELSFQMLIAPALIQTDGWSEPRAEAALERAMALAEALGDRRLPSALFLLAAVHELRGEYAQSQRYLERQQALPRPFETKLAELESHELMACSLYHQGAFEGALEHARAGLAVVDAHDLDSKLYAYGENPRVSCHNWAGLALWFLGFPDQAGARIGEGLALARKPGRRYSLSNALCAAATLHQLRLEAERAAEYADEAIEVAQEEGFRYPLAVARILKGWAMARTGQQEAGIGLIREGLKGHRASGANMDRPYYLGLLAEALAAAGRFDEALATLDDAIAQTDASRRFFQEAELLRLKAVLELERPGGKRGEALEWLEKSLAAARSQGNRIAQLRAETALVELADGKPRDARSMGALRKTLASFNEGFDAPDLRSAAALLS